LHFYKSGEIMTTSVEKKDGSVRYDKFPKWGKKPDNANQERILATRSLIPSDVRTILDLGCGDGAVTNELVEKGLDIFGADFSIVALGFVKGKPLAASVDSIPFPDQYFDMVLCAETIEHLPDGVYERTLSEIERVAKRYIIISTPNNEYLPTSSIKCENCQKVFHRNMHVQVFSRDIHNSLFQVFERKRTIGVQVWKQIPTLTNFQHILGIYPPGRGAICPNCDHSNISSPSLWQQFVLNIGYVITRLLPNVKKDQWIVSLYQRKFNNY
jgi:SAM-dependent methyltransferase